MDEKWGLIIRLQGPEGAIHGASIDQAGGRIEMINRHGVDRSLVYDARECKAPSADFGVTQGMIRTYPEVLKASIVLLAKHKSSHAFALAGSVRSR
ncbi:hypothetical protein SAMN06298226_2862 [Nitrosovibrio sp. Nv4]|nr:hypothetical protein SAMN06298226_2862 [Nitrosovibrio sp. Nv4]